MQRPHRTLRVRLQRRVAVHGGRLPPTVRRIVRRIADRVEPLAVGGAETAAVSGGQAEVVVSFDAWQTVADLAAALTEALVADGVEVARLERGGIVTLAVSREKRDAAFAALRQSERAAGWWTLGSGNRMVRLSDASPASLKVDIIPVFRLLTTADGTVLSGRGLAVQLEFWRTTGSHAPRPDGGVFPKGTRLAPLRNGVAPYIVPEQWRSAQQHPERLVRADAPPHLLSVVEPIDVVYTWVDGSDPSWQARRAGVDPHPAAAGRRCPRSRPHHQP